MMLITNFLEATTNDNATLIAFINSVFVFLGVVVTGFFSWRSAHSQKQDREFRRVKEELDLKEKSEIAEKEAARTKELTSMNEYIVDLSNNVKSIKKNVNQLGEDLNRFKDQTESNLNRVNDLSQINFEYIQSLSTVVTKLGTLTVTEDHAEEIQHALEAHQKTEKALSNRLYKINC